MKRMMGLLMLGTLVSGCSAVPERRGSDSPAPRSQSAPLAVSPAAQQCLTQLGAAGAQFTPLPDQYPGQGCSIIGTVQLAALQTDAASTIVSNLGPVTCPVGNAFAGWARYGVDRAARQILGSPLRSIETMGSYACRDVAGTGRRSGHASAAAIDVAAFVLEDGRRITVAGHWQGGSQDERRFLRTVQDSACKRFGTVLGPDYNAAHRDHFHVEGVIDGDSFCR